MREPSPSAKAAVWFPTWSDALQNQKLLALYRQQYNIRTLQDLVGHKSLS